MFSVLALRHIEHNTTQANDRSVRIGVGIVVVLVCMFDPRVRRCLGLDGSCKDRHAARDDLAELRLDAIGYVGEHLADGLSQGAWTGKPLILASHSLMWT